MTEPNHSTDDAPTIHSLDPAALGIDDNPLALGSRSPVGTCALVFDTPGATVEADALGERHFPAGAYVCVGSAFGTGGLRRVRRHRHIAAGDHDAHRWYVNCLGGHPSVDLVRIACVTSRDVKCTVVTGLASSLGSAPIDDFGSSGCPRDTHLTRSDSVETVAPLVEAAFRNKI